LLVVDNFEHLLDGARLIAEIRQLAPEVQILVTSREKLGLHGEQQYQLKGMRVPVKDIDVASAEELLAVYSSSRLFLQSAGRNTPDFALQPGDTRDLTQICQLVDGMPLALELAAGWVDMLSLSDIAAEIRGGMDFLETDALDMPDRHRSVEAIFEGTWRRLEPAEQVVFTQLCVFRGGFTRQAAREITGATLRQLAGLMNKSLLLFDRKINRYHIHRLLRYYGLKRLADAPEREQAFRDGHCDYYCDAMKRWGEAMKGSGQRQALEEMEADSQNILAAWEWAVSQLQVDRLNKSVDALHSYYVRSGRAAQWTEVCALALDRLASSNDPDAKRAQANLLLRQGWFLDNEADLALVQQAMDLINELDLAGHDTMVEKAFGLLRLGVMTRVVTARVDETDQLLKHSQDIYHTLGDEYATATVQAERGSLAFGLGDFVEAAGLFNASLRTRKAIGDRFGELNSLQTMAWLARYQDELEKGRQIEKQIVAVRRQEGDQLALANSLFEHGHTLNYLGEYKEARTTFHESTSIMYDLGLNELLDLHIWEDLSAVFDGDYECADKYRQAEEGRYDSWGLMQIYVLGMVGWVEMVQFNYSRTRDCFEKAVAVAEEHQRWNEIGMFQAWLALSLLSMNLPEDSKGQLRDALRMTLKTKSGPSLMHSLPAAALFLAREGQSEQAIEIYELACTFPHVANAPLFEDLVGNEIAAIVDSLPPEATEAARKRGRERDPWATAEELLAELEVGTAKA
jgi:predicted ATPase